MADAAAIRATLENLDMAPDVFFYTLVGMMVG